MNVYAIPAETETRLSVAPATRKDRAAIYRMRHDVYAEELAQHKRTPSGSLSDPLDGSNVYLTAWVGKELAGFVSITPPGCEGYAIDKYFKRSEVPLTFDDHLYEIRILTVDEAHRGTPLAGLLMYAALRWVESMGGTRIVALGRHEVMDMYLKVGLEPTGQVIHSGAVHYHLMSAGVEAMRVHIARYDRALERLQPMIDWKLDVPFRRPSPCYHGGAFFDAVGEDFDGLQRSASIINADVLDAWFPPAPGVTEALSEYLPWLLRTSPPTGCGGLIRAVARARGVEPEQVLPGSGSSTLMFLAFPQWLNARSRVLILDPTYGEYAHIFDDVIRCRLDRFPLLPEQGYLPDLQQLGRWLRRGYDLVVLVNPNSPTGRHIPREQVEKVLAEAPDSTRIWIDETYVDYVGSEASLESYAVQSRNTVVCKSMSKVYALSGARVAYLCASPHLLEPLRALTPPWAVSLPAQVAAVKALNDPGYYRERYRETHLLRRELASALEEHLGFSVVPGVANFILCTLPEDGPSAAEVVKRCREQGLFMRDAALMGRHLGSHALRVAVKDRATNNRMLEILESALASCTPPATSD